MAIKKILVLGTWLLVRQASGQGSTIWSGQVLSDATGSPIASATVTAVPQYSTVPATGPRLSRTISKADGSFQFDNLEAGPYRLCVTDAGEYLNPCQWTPSRIFILGPGSNVTNMRLTRGMRLRVVVDDSPGHTNGRLGVFQSPLSITISAPGGQPRNMPIVAQSAKVFEFAEFVPSDTDLLVRVSSKSFLLSDARGVAIDERGHPVAVRPTRKSVPPLAELLQRALFRAAQTNDVVLPIQIRGVVPR